MERAQRRKYHYIYKTICNATGRYYYGMHSTDNLDDGYIGSGKQLWYSINKHGKETHKLEKLEFFDSREKLRNKEKEIVNEELIKNKLCMNLQIGGGGGFVSVENQFNRSKAGGLAAIKTLKERRLDPLWVMMQSEKLSKGVKKACDEGRINPRTFTGKSHSEESKEKMRNADRTGNKNSQYGTCWITNGKDNKKIHKGDNIPIGWNLGRKIKKDG